MRREFSVATKRAAKERANGHCEGCGLPFTAANPPEYDHDHDDWMGGDNSLENCKVLGRKCCHQPKTAKAATNRAKADRIRDRLDNITKPSSFHRFKSNTRYINEESDHDS